MKMEVPDINRRRKYGSLEYREFGLTGARPILPEASEFWTLRKSIKACRLNIALY